MRDDITERALEAIESGYEATALELLEVLLTLDPSVGIWHYARGKRLLRLARYQEAEQALIRAYPSVSDASRYLVEFSLGELCESLGRFEEAERWFRKATLSNPRDTDPWVVLGTFLARRERAREACNVLALGLREEGSVDEVHLNVALCQRSLGEYAAAKQSCLAALQISPKHPEVKKVLRDVKLAMSVRAEFRPPTNAGAERGATAETGAESEHGGDVDGVQSNAAIRKDITERALEAIESGFEAAALELLEVLLTLDPSSVVWHNLRGVRLLRLARYKEAEQALMRAYPSFADDRRYLVEYSLGELCESLGRFEEAERWFRKATLSNRRDTGPWVFLGGFIAKRGRVREACGVLALGLRETGDIDEVHLNLALCQRSLGEYAAAKQSCLAALQISPQYPAATEVLRDLKLAMSVQAEFRPPTDAAT